MRTTPCDECYEHAICHQTSQRQTKEYRAELARVRADINRAEATGLLLRGLLSHEYKRKMFRREELQALIDRADTYPAEHPYRQVAP